MDKGLIKLQREVLEKSIWTSAMTEQKVLLVTLLMIAIMVENSSVRTILKIFEKTELLTSQSTPRNRLITIVNRGLYQCGNGGGVTSLLTSQQQAPNRRLTANKNDKNVKKSNRRKTRLRRIIYFYQLTLSPFETMKYLLPEELTELNR